MRFLRRLPVLVVLLACLAAPIASAQGAVYASPTGTASAPCNDATAANRCSLDTALASAAELETLFLAPGTYVRSTTLQIAKRVTVSGEVGQERPVIESPTGVGAVGVSVTNAGVTLRDLRVRSAASIGVGISLTGDSDTIERVESVGKAAIACLLKGKFAKAEDALCESKAGTGLRSEWQSAAAIEGVPMTATNVTAVGGELGIAIVGIQKGAAILYAKNTIAAGALYDVFANSAGEDSGAIGNFEFSNYAKTHEQGNGSTGITSNTVDHNQAAAPAFVDAANGDYRELLASSTRFAGTGGGGSIDVAGLPRSTTCGGMTGTDIGAYQLQECPPEPPPSGGGGTGGGSTGNGPSTGTGPGTTPPPPVVAPTGPSLSKLALSPRKFAVAGKGRKGSTVSFTLSEAATVHLEVLAKRRSKGRKTQLVRLGTVTVKSAAGRAKVRFSGKVGGKTLAPGAYVLRATAVSAGLPSAALTTAFTVTAGS
jgi:hypothetical protein